MRAQICRSIRLTHRTWTNKAQWHEKSSADEAGIHDTGSHDVTIYSVHTEFTYLSSRSVSGNFEEYL